MEIKIKQIVRYSGHSISGNGSVNLNFKSMYSELCNTLKLSQLLNNDIEIRAKLPNEKPFKLGSFRIKGIKIDDDGESSIKFNGLNDYVELDNLNKLATGEDFAVVYISDVEEEKGE